VTTSRAFEDLPPPRVPVAMCFLRRRRIDQFKFFSYSVSTKRKNSCNNKDSAGRCIRVGECGVGVCGRRNAYFIAVKEVDKSNYKIEEINVFQLPHVITLSKMVFFPY